MRDVTVIDYGVGNLHSLCKALERAGARPRVATRPEDFREARALVLPGVGAFGNVMSVVRPWQEELRSLLAGGIPALAVCVGMQILYTHGEEGDCPGLGLFTGAVRRLAHPRLPHMAWSPVQFADPADPLLDGIPDRSHFYFVHSFATPAEDARDGLLGTTNYGRPFAALVRRGRLVATQFHPEKSSDPGARLLSNWVRSWTVPE